VHPDRGVLGGEQHDCDHVLIADSRRDRGGLAEEALGRDARVLQRIGTKTRLAIEHHRILGEAHRDRSRQVRGAQQPAGTRLPCLRVHAAKRRGEILWLNHPAAS
jgi:hypothetical protein